MMANHKISVVMASYLSEYETVHFKCASDRETKFVRAVESFLNQSYTNCELIVVSDGCSKTVSILKSKYPDKLLSGKIKLVELDKQPLFSGKVRQAGVLAATGDLICYLDSDDMIGPEHLSAINDNFAGSWVYYDDYLYDGTTRTPRGVQVSINCIGTSAFCHSKEINLVWQDGYGHDWKTISVIADLNPIKIHGPEYLVCHVPGEIDD